MIYSNWLVNSIFRACLLVSIAGVLVCGCRNSYAGEQDRSADSLLAEAGQQKAEYKESLLSLDYSEVINGLCYLSPGDKGAGYAFGAPHQLLKEDLTPAEERLVGVIQITCENNNSLFETVMFAVSAAARSDIGEIPADGTELFTFLAEGSNELDKFLSASAENQYTRVAPGINAVTGRFFTSFSDHAWHPGGVVIEKETDPEYLRTRFTGYVDEKTGGLPNIWHVKVFGEEQDTVLLDKRLAINAVKREFPMPRQTMSQAMPH